MIKEFESYHGLVFARLFHSINRPICVDRFPTADNASYVIDGKIGIYIKYSSKRMPPWRYSFHRRHQEEILSLNSIYGNAFLLLVCKNDGIAVLNYAEIGQVLDEVHAAVEWISVTRPPRGMYSVKGSDGRLKLKIGKNDFPAKLFEITDRMAR